jgi:hypothetical protein
VPESQDPSSHLVGTISFSTDKGFLSGSQHPLREVSGIGQIRVDSEFWGITVLYNGNEPTHLPLVEWVSVSFNTFCL